ncbi:MAG: ECF transporter S component [Firmicutes bacterium]|nr:ECF transporter S component [Bacillota bacterium]
MDKRVLWITRTAVFLALLIVGQITTAPAGNTLITGSVVNLILIVAVMTCGLASGAAIAVISPVLAKLFGIGPLVWAIIPVQIAGNAVLVVLWHYIGNNRILAGRDVAGICALVIAAVMKFAVLHIGVSLVVMPLLTLPEAKAATISAMFSLPQLATASVGGAFALAILPVLRKAIKNGSQGTVQK